MPGYGVVAAPSLAVGSATLYAGAMTAPLVRPPKRPLLERWGWGLYGWVRYPRVKVQARRRARSPEVQAWIAEVRDPNRVLGPPDDIAASIMERMGRTPK